MHLNHQGMSFGKCSLWNWVSLHPNGQWWNQLAQESPIFCGRNAQGAWTYSITRSLWNELKRSWGECSSCPHNPHLGGGSPPCAQHSSLAVKAWSTLCFFSPPTDESNVHSHTQFIKLIRIVIFSLHLLLLFSEGKQRQRWLLSAFVLILTLGTRRPSTPPSLCDATLCSAETPCKSMCLMSWQKVMQVSALWWPLHDRNFLEGLSPDS